MRPFTRDSLFTYPYIRQINVTHLVRSLVLNAQPLLPRFAVTFDPTPLYFLSSVPSSPLTQDVPSALAHTCS